MTAAAPANLGLRNDLPLRARAVADHIAGMTDGYAIPELRRLFDPSEGT
jgi:dGTP triphosphohydrolase